MLPGGGSTVQYSLEDYQGATKSFISIIHFLSASRPSNQRRSSEGCPSGIARKAFAFRQALFSITSRNQTSTGQGRRIWRFQRRTKNQHERTAATQSWRWCSWLFLDWDVCYPCSQVYCRWLWLRSYRDCLWRLRKARERIFGQSRQLPHYSSRIWHPGLLGSPACRNSEIFLAPWCSLVSRSSRVLGDNYLNVASAGQ